MRMEDGHGALDITSRQKFFGRPRRPYADKRPAFGRRRLGRPCPISDVRRDAADDGLGGFVPTSCTLHLPPPRAHISGPLTKLRRGGLTQSNVGSSTPMAISSTSFESWKLCAKRVTVTSRGKGALVTDIQDGVDVATFDAEVRNLMLAGRG